MSQGVVAERYARALFELGSESGQLGDLAQKLSAFADVVAGSRDLQRVLGNPSTSKEQREALLSDLAKRLGVSDLGIKGLLLLGRRRRLAALPAIARRLVELSDQKQGIVRASVTTAQKMPESYYQALEKQLSLATSKKVMLSRREDASLLGGAITQLGDSIVDTSLEGRLEQAEQQLLRALSSLAAG